MNSKEKFITVIKDAYSFKGETIILGGAVYENEAVTGLKINLPLKTMNRHGLIAGATGTGKTKTLQLIAERLSEKSVPVLVMDIKGDLSGISKPGVSNPKIEERQLKIGEVYTPKASPVEFLSLSGEKGLRLRATVSEFGPILFSKILELNDTQAGIVSVIFKYCDDKKLPLLDLKDFKKILNYITNEGKQEIEELYGKISTSSTGIILRKVVELEQQKAEQFFGEKSFEVEDLVRIDENGQGIISVMRLTDLQDRPKLFSTFMLSLLAEIYSTFPEEGDLEQPRLVIFIDEAHLIFNEASKALLEQIETIIKLIRSKGVGVFFCTQNPMDVPKDVLGQLGLKIQHSLRAFTAQDRKNIKLTAENYPLSEFYDTETMLTSMGIGEAAVTMLNEKGIPTPLARVLLAAPKSRMDILTDEEINQIVLNSKLLAKYNQVIDRESAYEILNTKINEFNSTEKQEELRKSNEQVRGTARTKSQVESVLNSPVVKQVGRTVARELARGLLGVLGLGGSSKKKSIF